MPRFWILMYHGAHTNISSEEHIETKKKKNYIIFQTKVLLFVVGGRFWLQFSSVHCGPVLQSNENMPSLIHMSWQMAAILIAALKKCQLSKIWTYVWN